MHSALDAGIRVPEDLQIVSFNNTRLVKTKTSTTII